MVKELWEYRELISRLVGRNISGQFRQSFLGYVWIALPPIATTVIFTLLRRSSIVNVPMPDNALPYTLFVLVNSTIWQFFTQVTMMGTGSIAGGGAMISKIYFPREVLVFSHVGNAVVNLGVQTLVIVLTFALFRFVPSWRVLYIPFLLLPAFLFAVGLGMILAPINTMMHDISRLLSFSFQFGMFLTPTVYPTPDPAAITTRWEMLLYWFHTVNPVSHIIHSVDSAVQGAGDGIGFGFVCATIISLMTFAIGWRFLHICEPMLAERL